MWRADVKRVAVLGGGTVGAAVVRLLQARGDVALTGVLVRDVDEPRPFADARALVTTDEDRVLGGADVVVEVIGGVGRAVDLGLRALDAGAVLVSANKAALAERWDDYLPYLRQGKVHFEAAVMAGTPVIGPLSTALRGSAPVRLDAVLNGTCNVILAAMERGVAYEAALADAQRAGYAEADPTLDVDGVDAAHKLTLLARLAFDPDVAWSDVLARTRGIRGLRARQMAQAWGAGRRIRLVASVAAGAAGWEARVRPVTLPAGHPLVTDGPVNALRFVGEPLGEVLVRGPGAGGGATASGVVGDVLAALAGRPGPTPANRAAELPPTAGADDDAGSTAPDAARERLDEVVGERLGEAPA